MNGIETKVLFIHKARLIHTIPTDISYEQYLKMNTAGGIHSSGTVHEEEHRLLSSAPIQLLLLEYDTGHQVLSSTYSQAYSLESSSYLFIIQYRSFSVNVIISR